MPYSILTINIKPSQFPLTNFRYIASSFRVKVESVLWEIKNKNICLPIVNHLTEAARFVNLTNGQTRELVRNHHVHSKILKPIDEVEQYVDF